jgi:hypothetical protein
VLLLVLISSHVFADASIYESSLVVRESGKPAVLQETFPAVPGGGYRVLVRNGVETGNPVTSAVVRLNGESVFMPGDFGRKVATIERPATLRPENSISIEVRGEPGSALAVSVQGSTVNLPPLANAGADRVVPVGQHVVLDGSASTDPDNDPLSYRWELTSIPPGSAAVLSDAGAVQPSFLADQPGDYVVVLVVNDGTADSGSATVTITAEPGGPPVLRIGSARGREGTAGAAAEYVFTVTLSAAVADPVSVDFETADYTAVSGEDHEPASGTLVIPAGATTAQIRVRALGDDTPESDEQFGVVLSNPSAGVELRSGNVGVGTIVDDDTPPIATANLANSSTYVGAGGVAVSALANTLRRPIEVTISAAAMPAEPLPPNVERWGGFYRLAAHEDTSADDGSLFILSLPVPNGFDTGALALATLTPASGILDGSGDGDVWVLTPGVFDPAEDVFRTAIPFLPGAGQTIVLVQQPDFQSPAAAPTAPVARLATAAADPDPNDVVYEGFDFFVECEGFPASEPCSDRLKVQASGFFKLARSQLRNLGYPEPWLIPNVKPDSFTANLRPRADGWKVFVSPSGSANCLVDKEPVAGVYITALYKLVVCTEGRESLTPSELNALYHEYFHAVQWGEPVLRNGGEDPWIIESTAAAAEESIVPAGAVTQLNRSADYGVRAVHISLSDEGASKDVWEYEAQDFWVYAGRTRGNKDLGALKLLFALGADNDAADFTLRRVFGSSLGDMYWEWAKNQAYEKNERFADATGSNEVLGPECRLEAATVPEDTIVVEPEFDTDITVKPLSTVVAQFRTPLDEYWSLWSRGAYPQQDPSDIRVKFYNLEGLPCGGGIPDGSRFINDAYPGNYFVVISNLSTETEQRVRIDGDAIK